MTNAVGCDVSVWQKYFDPSKATGRVDFAIQKITDGITVHGALDTMWAGVKQVGIRGAYHYQRNGKWQEQAELFLSVAGAKDFHILALDLEGYGNTVDPTFLSDTRRIIDYWMSKTDKRIVLYTNGDYYKQLRALVSDVWLNNIALWFANPNNTPGVFPLPAGRTDWSIHQYSWTGSFSRWGTGASTDEDVFNGTVEQMQIWAGIMPENGEQPMTNGTAKENGGRTGKIRTTPSRWGTVVGTVAPYSTIEFESYANTLDVTAYPNDKYFRLPNGSFLNYIIDGVQYFDVLTEPTTEPPLPVVSPVTHASFDFDLATKTMVTTRRRQDGTSDIDRDPIA